ncbi:MAG: hypothetical protein HYW25_06185 [Candidatus Aenigmarchaeota archaeon]|nr:hypothetical protein [Candidatus Aenigmarchaeota archaeon]
MPEAATLARVGNPIGSEEILGAVAYVAVEGKRHPASAMVFHTALSLALLEYITGEEQRPPSCSSGTGTYFWERDGNVESETWRRLRPILARNEGRIQPRIERASADMLETPWVPGYDHSQLDMVYHLRVLENARPGNAERVFFRLSPKEREDVENLGRLMRKYLDALGC